MWELFQADVDSDPEPNAMAVEEKATSCWSISVAAISGIPAPKTMQLPADIQGHQVLVLIDSRSSHSFVSTKLAKLLSRISALHKSILVKVADGGKLSCSEQLIAALWSANCYEFHTDLKVLPLCSYDLIIGMDWLEVHCPMKVH
ncbi:hypothetical protein PR202_gb08141 [Eleusine coracana subsp. coracana]|uniref:Gag protease polyprotein n=1 Tax=Eleusine coracana subsp. coracana TaxID=191504 RepID=A0AAV5EBG8_ELECO|nr:hypothetical protein PR202_gb08141 [Eleusine coracana subsp. coracana]